MEYKKFRLYKILIAIILAIIVSSGVTSGNYLIPIIAVVAAAIAMLLIKTKVKDVISDERIEKLAGKASRITLIATAVAMAATSFVLIALKEKFPELLPVGYALSYFACGMLLLYSFVFKYYYSRGE